MRVLNKTQNFDLFGAGCFGNRLRQWRTLAELKSSGFRNPVFMRYAGSAGGGFCTPDVPIAEVENEIARWLKRGAILEQIYFNEPAPNSKSILQAELVPDPRFGYAIHYSTAPMAMREALKADARNHCGPGALLIAKQVMTLHSFEDLRAVMERHPESAIEFSVFSVLCGNLPRRNSIIWEVRNY